MSRKRKVTEDVRRSGWFLAIDRRLTAWLGEHAVTLSRVSLGVIFLWFGVLKFIPGASPAADLATRTVERVSLGLMSPDTGLMVLATWEVLIGLGLLTARFLRVTLLLLFVQMIGTLLPLVLYPAETFIVFPLAPTLEGQYIIKNLVLVSAAAVVGATLRGRGLAPEPGRIVPLVLVGLLIGCGTDRTPESIGQSRTDTVVSRDRAAIVHDVYLSTGDNPAIVLVHCWSCDRFYWAGQVTDLSRDYTVVTVDLAGHGDSSSGDRTDFTVAAFGDDVAAVVEELESDHVILVGHSMGGTVVTEAARKLGGRVRGVVWVDSYHAMGDSTSAAEIEAFVAPFDSAFVEHTRAFVRSLFATATDSALVERVANDMAAAPPTTATSALRNTFHFDVQMPAVLAALRVPAITINGDLFPTDTLSLRQHGVEAMILQGTGHFPHLEAPLRFSALLRRVLAEMDSLTRPAGNGSEGS